MKLVTRKTRAATAAASWGKFYGGGKYGEEKQAMGAKLKALGPAPCPDRVDEIAGSTYWTRIRTCDECRAKVDALIDIDQHVQICKPCVSKALEMFDV